MNQITIFKRSDLSLKIEAAITRLKTFEENALEYSPNGYYLAYSGGKDSDAIITLAEQANVKFKAYYNLTTVDHPELVKKIKKDKRITICYPKLTMWKLIEKSLIPPTRMIRYCCSELKEHGGDGLFCITGVRWAESVKRKQYRTSIELNSMRRYVNKINDNDEGRRMIENCKMRSKHILNPIVNWTNENVWDFIKAYKIDYCKLYDCGYKRLGCIGCPNAGHKQQLKDFEKYPRFRSAYIRAFDKMLIKRKEKNLKTLWKNGEDVFDWWTSPAAKTKININQISMEELIND